MNIEYIKEQVKTVFSGKPVNKAYLFGSFLHKPFDKIHDIDILLNLEQENDFSLIDFSRLQIDLSDNLGKKVDLLTEDSISQYILPSITREKILIYEKL